MYALNPFIPSATIPFAQFRLHFALPTVLELDICYIDNDSLFDFSKEPMSCQALTLYSTKTKQGIVIHIRKDDVSHDKGRIL